MKENFTIKPPKGIYVHIPFCVSKCAYCSFYSLPGCSDRVKLKYITRLKDQIRQYEDIYPDLGKTVSTIYFGGGTPTVLAADDLTSLLQSIISTFKIKPENLVETTVEANPESASLEELIRLREGGFNRLSLGIQSLKDNTLKIIRRAHNRDGALKALTNAVQAGFDNISADVIFGIPGQSEEEVAKTLNELTEIEEIRHISAYSLSVEPDTPLEQEIKSGRLRLPDEEAERQIQYLVNRKLNQAGFEHYEISNYAKPGFRAVHNSHYWDMSGYLGLGPGAASFVDKKRWSIKADLKSFLDGKLIEEDSHTLDRDEFRGDFMFLGLRRLEGVDDLEYQKLFSSSFFKDYSKEIKRLTQRGLVKQVGNSLRLTQIGLDLANQVFLEFV